MKHLFFLILILTIPLVSGIEEITYFVHDGADIFSPDEENMIIGILKPLQKSGIAEIAVVTINELEPTQTIETKAIELAHETLGEKGKDNGLLLLISKNDRKFRIEVGYGLEGDLPDLKVANFAEDHMVPEFKNNNFGKGVIQVLQRISLELSGNEELLQEVREQEQQSKKVVLITNIIFFIIFGLIFYRYYRSAKRRGLSDGEFMGLLLLGGMHGHGRGGGGFSGFGGGGFGGGGFSGGW